MPRYTFAVHADASAEITVSATNEDDAFSQAEDRLSQMNIDEFIVNQRSIRYADIELISEDSDDNYTYTDKNQGDAE